MQIHGKRDDTLVHESEPYNAEPAPAALGAHRLTPVEAFYSRNHGPIPELDASVWALVVDGSVDSPLRLSLADLRRDFEHHEVEATLQCAGNRRSGLIEVADIPGEDPWRAGAIGTAAWTGARLGDVLRRAGIRTGEDESSRATPGAGLHVAFEAPDVSRIPDPPSSYGSSIDLPKALGPEVLIAWQMNGSDLTPAHGAPARVVAPGYIGARSVKWLRRVTVQDRPSDNYFQATAYRVLGPDADPAAAGPGDGISLGPWSLNSAILDPAPGAVVPTGRLRVHGYAVAAPHRTAVRVEVTTDERHWVDGVWDDEAAPWTWRRWHADVEVPRGATTLTARVWDDSGAQQPRNPEDLWNPKGYGNTSWPRVPISVPSA